MEDDDAGLRPLGRDRPMQLVDLHAAKDRAASLTARDRYLAWRLRSGTCPSTLTVAVLLGLGAALCYGLSDFLGGLVSRRVHYASSRCSAT